MTTCVEVAPGRSVSVDRDLIGEGWDILDHATGGEAFLQDGFIDQWARDHVILASSRPALVAAVWVSFNDSYFERMAAPLRPQLME